MRIIRKRTYSNREVMEEGRRYLKTQSTYTLSEELEVPQATIWFHLNRDLKELDYTLYLQVRRKLEYNRKRGY